MAPSGKLYTVAGICESEACECEEQGTVACSTKCGTGDGGLATEARLLQPQGIDLEGDLLYISDTGNNRIRVVRLR